MKIELGNESKRIEVEMNSEIKRSNSNKGETLSVTIGVD